MMMSPRSSRAGNGRGGTGESQPVPQVGLEGDEVSREKVIFLERSSRLHQVIVVTSLNSL